MIIYHISKVVGWVAVGLKEDLIVQDIVVEDYLSMNHVSPFTDALRHEHSDNMLLSTCYPRVDFRVTQVKAEPIVLCSLMLLPSLLYSQLLQSISSAEAMIGFSPLKDSENKGFILPRAS